jgi:SAM-dependent methyltransferase
VAEMFSNALAYEDMMGRWSVRLAPLFVKFAQIADHGRILDVGCGTGSLTRTLAAESSQFEIVGIDPVQPFIEYARAQLTDRRVTFERADALALPYPPASFDHTLSMLVLMFVPDPDKAAHEMRRVTRVGGTVAACTWDRVGLEMTSVFWEEALKLDPEAEARAERPRRLNQPGQLTALWRTAGLQRVEETTLEISTDFSSFDDYWQPFLKKVGPHGVYVADLTPQRRETLRKAIQNRLLGDRGEGLFSLQAKALAVRGSVPAR